MQRTRGEGSSEAAVVKADWLRKTRERLERRLCRRHGNDEAADLAAEVVVRCLAHPSTEGRQDAWAERILANLRADESRRRARGARFVRLDLPTATTAVDPEHLVLASERRRCVRQALLALPKAQRRLVLERFFADRAGPPKSATSRTRIHRALVLLRQRLGSLTSWLAPVGFWPRAAASAPFGAATGVLVLTLASTEPPTPAGKYLAPSPRASAEKYLAPSPRALAGKYLAPSGAGAGEPSVRYDFEDDEVTGDIHQPDHQVIVGREGASRHESLLEIPSSFATALVRSVDEL